MTLALNAFNAAITITNAAHATKRAVTKAATATADGAVASTQATKEAGTAFWAGMKYAHTCNKTLGVAADTLKAEDIAPKAKRARKAAKV